MIYKAGQILSFEEGPHFEVSHVGIFVTLCDLNLRAAQDEFRAAGKSDPFEFGDWLVATGKCAPVEHITVHIGEYGQTNIDA
jgi:hypothetical protein